MPQPAFVPDQYQQSVIDHIHGAILVLAPVGTGKTSVLTERLLNAAQAGIEPSRLLSVTFTNRAAQEMQARLKKQYPEIYKQVTVKTFHGLCAHMLRIEAANIGLPADFTIYDESDCIELVKEVFGVSEFKKAKEIYHKLQACKTNVTALELRLETSLEDLYQSFEGSRRGAIAYQTALQERHALDFADLIYHVRAMLHQWADIRHRWQHRYDFVQVDEVQDTHLAEYEVIRELAYQSGNLAMIGDLDQSIYGWRGSEPKAVIGQFKEDFRPTRYSLIYNYRATRTLLKAATGFANCFEERFTEVEPADSCEAGAPIERQHFPNEIAESFWIANQIQSLATHRPGFKYSKTAVLVRSHKKAEIISRILTQQGVPCLTVEQYELFKRQEIKDALAYLQIMVNPHDAIAFRRILRRFGRGIGAATLNRIVTDGQSCGLRLTDFATPQPFVADDPLGHIIQTYREGTLIVFDVETTGISITNDVIEIAAVKLVNGKVVDQFHGFIADAEPVGDSISIHGYSNEHLIQHGRSAQEVFTAFRAFTGDALLVGHNVGFDIKMVSAHAQRAGITLPQPQWADTWDLAKRVLTEERYSLGHLAKALNLKTIPNHQAADDVSATVELLHHLVPKLEAQAEYRQAIVYRDGERFEDLAQAIANWVSLSATARPAALLAHILQASGLKAYYQREAARLQNLQCLLTLFSERDDDTLPPYTALRSLLEFTALAKNIDQLSEQDNQVLLVTVHQSKGLEFDNVFIAGMSENEFPTYYSTQNGEFEEEKRLFYVALTRAKQQLFISSCAQDSFGQETAPSRFLRYLLQ
jgi:DNA helicase II / ATP-dependent DNA helicase PcrA